MTSDPTRPITTESAPRIGDPPSADPEIRVTRQQVRDFLSRRGLPVTRRNRKKARSRLIKREERRRLPKGVNIPSQETDQPFQIVYGLTRVGGSITFINQNIDNEYLDVIVSIAGHKIQALDAVFCDGNLVDFGGAIGASTWQSWAVGGRSPAGAFVDYSGFKLFTQWTDGDDAQSVLSAAKLVMPAYWTDDHRQRGVAHIFHRFVWDPRLYAGGVPDVNYLVRGKLVYDPRTATTAYSNNAALVIADFLTDTRIGMGISTSDIDWNSVDAAADVCDENVVLLEGGSEARYTINGAFDNEEPKNTILDSMLDSMAGDLYYSGGKWKIYAAEARSSVITLTESDITGAIEVEAMVSADENFNSVRGKYAADAGFASRDYPSTSPSTYVAADNGKVRWAEIDFSLVTSVTQAQRLRNIYLNRIRKKIRVAGVFKMKAFELEPGDVCTLTLTKYGISSLLFEVVEAVTQVYPDLTMGVELVLEETASDVYDWDPSDATAVVSGTQLNFPDPNNPQEPTSLTVRSGTKQLYRKADGTVVSRIQVSYDAIRDQFVISGGLVEAEAKLSSASTWESVGLFRNAPSFFYVWDVEDTQAYDVRVRFVNAFGATSDWATVTGHTVIGKTEPPSTVTGFGYEQLGTGYRLFWTSIADKDLKEYEIRSGPDWGGGQILAIEDSNSWDWLTPSTGATTLLLRAKDTSGNYSQTSARKIINTLAPGAPRQFTGLVLDNSVRLSWQPPSTGSLPISQYIIRRGAEFSTASDVTSVNALGYVVLEVLGGTYTYWCAARDSAGNIGTPVSITVEVQQYPGFSFEDDADITVDWDTSTNAHVAADNVLAPVEVGESWDDHFSDNGFSSFADAADEFEFYCQPNPLYAVLQKTIDFGSTYTTAIVSLELLFADQNGPPAVETILSVSSDDVTYTDFTNQTVISVSNVRYVKVRLNIGSEPITEAGQVTGIPGLLYEGTEQRENELGAFLRLTLAKVSVFTPA